MFCKWCGMESVTTDQCSWCHRPFTTATEASDAAKTAPADTGEEPEETSPLAAQVMAASPSAPIAANAQDTEAAEIIAPWDNAAVSAPETEAASAPSPSPAPVIGVRRPGQGRSGAHVPAPAMPPRAPAPASAAPPASTQAGQAPAARAHAPAPAGTPAITPRRPSEAPPSRPHTPAPPIPAIAARAGSAPSAPIVNRAGESPASAPTAPASTSRTALPSALLGGGKPPVTDAEDITISGGLADGVAIPPAAATPSDTHVPELGTFTPAKSKYYPGQVLDPVSGTHYDSASGTPTSVPVTPQERTEARKEAKEKDIEFIWDKPQATMWHLVGRYLGVFAILLALGILAAAIAPGSYVVPLLLTNFIGGMLLPVMRVVPWQDEDSDDVFLMVVLTLAFGPVVSLIIYSVLTALRQDGNPAILGILAVAMLARVGIGLASGTLQSWWQVMPFPLQGFSVSLMLVNWAGLAALVGWYVANVFHKLDE